MLPHVVFGQSPITTPDAALRRLFLTLFLRGRNGRHLDLTKAPTSLGRKLSLTLLFYAAFGCIGLTFIHQPVFGFSAYLHAMTFAFVGLFVASSSGEILFNREEADILLHRPVAPGTLLWAKMRVMVEVSLWLAGAFNLGGLLGGAFALQGGLRFALAHLVSTLLMALFTVGSVVLVYQVCLQRFGRERLESLMTAAQVLVGVGAMLAGQLPRLLLDAGNALPASLTTKSWWLGALPPAWFAGLDDAVHGGAAPSSWILALVAVAATALVLWLAFGQLAHTYTSGLQTLNEHTAPVRAASEGRPWHQRVAGLPILRTWLRDPVTRASFQLTAAYLFRDRDLKLRLYPGLAPFLVMPLISILQEAGRSGGKGFSFALMVSFLGVIPLTALSILQHSAQWQAGDLFRAAPLQGPGPLCDGARRAILTFLVLPLVALVSLVVLCLPAVRGHWPLLLPGLLIMPACSRIPSGHGWAPPLSMAIEEAQNARRGVWMFLAMMGSMALAGLALGARHFGVLGWFLGVETALAMGLYAWLRHRMARSPWSQEG